MSEKDTVRVNLRLAPEKVKAIQAATADLGIVNLTSCCNYLLNKGLEQSSAMAAAARSAQANVIAAKFLSGLMDQEKAALAAASILDNSPQVVTPSKSIPDSDLQEGSEDEG